RRMQDEGIDVVGAEVAQRARERLRDLLGERGLRVVRDAARILPGIRRELRLHEQRLALDDAAADDGRDRTTDGRLVVMLRLRRGVDAAKAELDRALDERLRALLLPSSAVEDPRHRPLRGGHPPRNVVALRHAALPRGSSARTFARIS